MATTNEFVVQIHNIAGAEHYDLMLQVGQALATWQSASSPAELSSGLPIPARKLGDHRLIYLTYEGPISNNRGEVRILDKGTYELLQADAARLVVRLAGKLITGLFELCHVGPSQDRWSLNRLEG